MENTEYAKKKIIWVNLLFFVITTLVGLIGAPLYLRHFGFQWQDWALFVFYLAATGLGVTVGYHRLFAHVTYQAHPVIQFLLLFFGAAAFEQPALQWASQHRNHHLYVDTDRDPYDIKKGFWYAHIGWLVFWEHKLNFDNVKDLKQNRLVMHQYQHYMPWAVFSGILLPMIIGAMTGHFLGAFILAVCLRLTVVYHCTFFINSVCHMFGKATYDIHATAKDHWVIAMLTYGEGYHNFHHRFPSDYRNGVRWYQWDPSKWLIRLLSLVGLTGDLKRVSRFRILQARIAADNLRIREHLTNAHKLPNLKSVIEKWNGHYQKLRHQLSVWETAAKDHQNVLTSRVQLRSSVFHEAALKKIKDARVEFMDAYRQWRRLSRLQLGLQI